MPRNHLIVHNRWPDSQARAYHPRQTERSRNLERYRVGRQSVLELPV